MVYSNFHPSPDIVFLQFFHWINIKVKFTYMDSLKGLEISLLIVHYRKKSTLFKLLSCEIPTFKKTFFKDFFVKFFF